MADTPIDSANQLLNAFVHRKKTRDNTVALNAQRLVNLFRQLSVFKPEFVAEYNKMLLSSSDEVRMMMKDIVGGPTVRQYLDYLQAKSEQLTDADEYAEENAQTISAINSNTGYLPDPDEDKPFVMAQGQAGTEMIADLSQSDVLVQMLKMFQENNQKQIETLTDTLKELKNQFKKGSTPTQQNQSTDNMITTQDLIRFQEAQQTAFEQLVRMQNESLSAITMQFAKSLEQREQIVAKKADEEQIQQEITENYPDEIESQTEETIVDATISEADENAYTEESVVADEAMIESDEEKQEIAEFESDSQVLEEVNEEEEEIEPLSITPTEDIAETEIEDFESDEDETLETEAIEPEAEASEVETAEIVPDEDIVETDDVETRTESSEVEMTETVPDEGMAEGVDVEPENTESEEEKETISEVEPIAAENEFEIQNIDEEPEPTVETEENTSILEEPTPIVSLSPIPDIPLSLRPVIEQSEAEEQAESEQINISEMPEIESEPMTERGAEPQPVEEAALKTPTDMSENAIPTIPSLPPIPHIGMPLGRHIPSGMPRPVPHVPPLPHAPMLGRKPIPAPMPSAGLSQNKMSVGQATKQDPSTKSTEEENIEILNDIEL